MRIAAAAYPVEALPDWDALGAKLEHWVVQSGDADLLVFPEYAGLEAGLLGVTDALDVAAETERCRIAAPRYWDILARLARRFDKVILAGSLPAGEPGTLRNRAALIRPDGQAAFIDKIVLTPWERTQTPLTGGNGAGVFTLHGLPPFAVLICYDGEFPVQARALTEAGAQVLLMPSATEATTGHNRVRIGARARALESGGVTALAQIVGCCDMSAYADISTGRAGLYAPPDAGRPADGILTETALGMPGWAIATVPTALKPEDRQVDIAAHWNEQQKSPSTPRFAQIGQNLP
jgi:predicted amidohydrolase